MNDVINEINGALQLEEGLKAEEGAMNIEIPQYASQSKTYDSLETILDHKFEWQKTFDDVSDFAPHDIWTSYRLGFVKPYSNEMDEVILRRILLYITNKENINDRKIMSNLSKSSFMNTSS